MRLCESRRYYRDKLILLIGIGDMFVYDTHRVVYGMESYHLEYLSLLLFRILWAAYTSCAAVGRARVEHAPSRRINLFSEALGVALNVSFLESWLVVSE